MKRDVTLQTSGDIPVLRSVTRPLADLPDLLSFADSKNPLVWNRGDRGCVGVGEALRLVFRGENRFIDASRVWREIAARADIDDPVKMPGSGLLAFGTFAFDDESASESVLIVPRLLINRHRSVGWITEVSLADDSLVPSGIPVLPEPSAIGSWPGVAFVSAENSGRAKGLSGTDGVSTVDAYLAGVREATRRIDAGGVEKVVLARQIIGVIDDAADLRVPIARLSERYLDCWTFAVDGLVGASPETLVRSTGGAVSARALAGTRGRHVDDERRDRAARDELLRSAKEQHEHDFAVQSVITALSPHVRDLRTSDEPFALQLPNVWHLATDLGAVLGADATSLELVDALHPTAAVAGTPTADAVATIAELEPFDRGRYSGAVGWIDSAGDGEWVIALRCAQISEAQISEAQISEAQVRDVQGEVVQLGGDAQGDAVQLGDAAQPGETTQRRTIVASAGGGIVAGSDPQHEYGETVSKFRPITEAFAE